MSKYDSLLKKVQVFEKIAVYGSRKEFLQALAQNLSRGTVAFPSEVISDALGAVSGTAVNLARLLEGSQQASTYESEMAKKISDTLYNSRAPSYVTDKSELNAKANPFMALLGNSIDVANRVLAPNYNVDQQAKETADQLKAEAKKALSAIYNFYKANGVPLEDLETVPSPEKTVTKAPNKSVPTSSAVLQAQKDLNKLNIGGMSGPLKENGLKDRDMHYALNQYREKNKARMFDPNMSDDLLYVMIHRDATGQNNPANISGLRQVVEKGPKPNRTT